MFVKEKFRSTWDAGRVACGWVVRDDPANLNDPE